MEISKPAPQTRDLRPEAAGTNAKYIDLADKIVAERPEMAKAIEARRGVGVGQGVMEPSDVTI